MCASSKRPTLDDLRDENNPPTRNSVVLASFVAYCETHPDERFWQALRNWSGYHLITAITIAFRPVTGVTYSEAFRTEHDTFNWEGRNGKEI